MIIAIDHSEHAHIISLIKQGDQDAFSVLYDKFSAAMYGVILKIVQHDMATAEDSLQDSFVKIWKNIQYYDEQKGSLFTWMLTIARNTALDKLSSLKSKQIQSLDSTVSIPSDQYRTNTDTIGLTEILGKLSPEFRSFIDLAYFKGMTQSEIAVYLNIPLGTVKTKTRAAMVELRKMMS